eukprot:103559_1
MKCYILLFDGSFKMAPPGVMPASTADIAHETFTLFHILFAAGKNTRRKEDYQDAMKLIIKSGIKHFNINLTGKTYRGMADLEKPERNGILLEISVSGGYMDACGWHFTELIRKALKSFDLWDPYLHNSKFHHWGRCLMSTKDAPPKMVRDAFDLCFSKIEEYTPKEKVKLTKRLMIEYFEKQFMDGQYQIIEWNCYRKLIRVNSGAESKNNDIVNCCGVHNPL